MDPLTAHGWNGRVADQIAAIAEPGDEPGRVVLVRRVNCDVVTRSGTVTAVPSPRLADRPDSETLPAVGDWVVLTHEEDTEAPVVVGICPRDSAISRRDPADEVRRQVLATNIDVVFVVHGMDRDRNLRRMERSLALAWDSGATPVVVLTKADLVDDPGEWAAPVREVAHDTDLVVTSARTGLGLEELRDHATGNRTIALLGASGSGKSSLVNALAGEDLVQTGDVRRDAKGRHTTVARELIPLPGGGVLVDTPGLRGLGLWDAEMGVDLAFPDVVELAEACRFRDCVHDHEPGCAVKAAIETGELPERRLESYQRLVAELEDLSRRRQEQERRRPEQRPGRGRTGRRARRR